MIARSEVVIVGGGPIGLAHALGLRKLNKRIRVVVLEKYQEYQRSHTLVMQPRQLEKLMKVTEMEHHPELSKLLRRLKKDPHIRTNELESIFKKVAIENGVEIVNEEVKKETINEQITKHCHGKQPALIIGADGTHSVVSDTLFPEGNQVKHEFDYVLQFRYEVKGKHKAESISSFAFFENMAQHGFVANEYVGHFADGKTPVTMQMMISKEVFDHLKNATSKNPIKPFADSKQEKENENKGKEVIDVYTIEKQAAQADEKEIIKAEVNGDKKKTDKIEEKALTINEVPEEVRRFVFTYLQDKIKTFHLKNEMIDPNSIRISVNEAPATHAKQVVNTENTTPVLLVGDAGLGLSYFKGLNAGLEAAAKFFNTMHTAIKQGFANKETAKEDFAEYQNWFVNNYAPKKVKEVEEYSRWHIRSVMKVVSIIRNLKMLSANDDQHVPIGPFRAYFDMNGDKPLSNLSQGENWRLYPHRDYDPVKLGQFKYVPITHSLKKTAKIFVDYVKPYKSDAQRTQDFRQPLVGFVNLGTGLIKIVTGLFTLNVKRFGDGIFSTLRGIVEIVTTPLSFIIKPITRAIATSLHDGRLKIEENVGMKKLAEKGHEYLDNLDPNSEPSKDTTHKLLLLCDDLHRKYMKCVDRGQESSVQKSQENVSFEQLRKDKKFDKNAVNSYFSLFYKKPVRTESSSNTAEELQIEQVQQST